MINVSMNLRGSPLCRSLHCEGSRPQAININFHNCCQNSIDLNIHDAPAASAMHPAQLKPGDYTGWEISMF